MAIAKRCKHCGKLARHTGFKFGTDICADCYFKFISLQKEK